MRWLRGLRRFVLYGSTIILLVSSVSADSQTYAEIIGLFSTGSYNKAEVLVEDLITTTPSNPNVRFLKAIILENTGRRTQSTEIYKSLIADHPHCPQPYNNLAMHYAQDGKYDEAIELLGQAFQTDANYATSYNNLKKIYSRLAVEAYSNALQTTTPVPDLKLESVVPHNSPIKQHGRECEIGYPMQN